MTIRTSGRWHWWTSNSWRRLGSDLGHGKTAWVLMPQVARDGCPDIAVTEPDMALIAAAPDLLTALWVAVGALENPEMSKTYVIAMARAALSKAEGFE